MWITESADTGADTAGAIRSAAARLRTARRVVVATGAGMARESGIPTFREAQAGLWARYQATELATLAAFRHHPARVFGWYAWRRRLVRAAAPTRAITRWSRSSASCRSARS